MSIKPLNSTGPTLVPGFVFAGMAAGIKKRPGVLDLALLQTTTLQPAACAALFTINVVKAAPVVLGLKRLRHGVCRAIVVNSGNANACTGPQGEQDALETSQLLAKTIGCSADEIMVSSTGVIGALLPMARFREAIPKLVAQARAEHLVQAAEAIRTTDTFAKWHGVHVNLGGKNVTIAGIAKGSGMIAPNMATMLAFLATDAVIAAPALQEALRLANASTFNAITVDGEMSTNDTIMALANGHAGHANIKLNTPEFEKFCAALTEVCDFLARQVVRDGEGSTKFVELQVSGMDNADHLKTIAMAIANSALVKTALCGNDANWGRILSAAGAAAARLGLPADFSKASIRFNDTAVYQQGVPVGTEAEAKAHAIIKSGEFILRVTLGSGKASQKVYFTDLTQEYIRINADYRS